MRRRIYRPAGTDAGYLQHQSTETLRRMLEVFSGKTGFQGFPTGREMRNRRMEQAQRIAKMISGAIYEEADSGHFMNVQTPALFAETAVRFFKGN